MTDRPSVTVVDEQEIVPALPQIAAAIPIASTRHLIDYQLGRGGTPDGVTGATTAWLLETLDWRAAGVPSGRLGPAGEGLLRAAVRVLVDGVERARQPPPVRRSATPRPTRPAPVARVDEPIALGPDTSEER